jgi:hypothetical protein
MLYGHDRGDGFWSCKYNDLVRGPSKQDTNRIINTFPAMIQHQIKHYSAEERSRATEAFNLCAKLGHPSDSYLTNSLDNGNFTFCNLTSQDLRNARELYGPCLACLEGKIKDGSQKPSQSEPAQNIGDHLHSDLIPLTNTSVGGNTFILFAVDEKSGYSIGIPLKSKASKNIVDGYKTMIQFFNSYGHKVTKITVDDERTLLSAKPELSMLGIQLTSTPAGLHEKRAERYIQTLKSRKRAMLAQLSYELPSE